MPAESLLLRPGRMGSRDRLLKCPQGLVAPADGGCFPPPGSFRDRLPLPVIRKEASASGEASTIKA